MICESESQGLSLGAGINGDALSRKDGATAVPKTITPTVLRENQDSTKVDRGRNAMHPAWTDLCLNLLGANRQGLDFKFWPGQIGTSTP